jgi:hypothetical protein
MKTFAFILLFYAISFGQYSHGFSSGGSNYSPPYKSAVLLLTQTGTNAPVITTLYNNIGNITSSYSSSGVYNLISSGLFVINKTFILANTNDDPVGNIMKTVNYSNANTIIINTYSINYFVTDDQIEPTSLDDSLNNFCIEIRVYK